MGGKNSSEDDRMKTKKRLLRCPFCGKASQRIEEETVHCEWCGADGPKSRYKDDAIKQWNKRYKP